MIPSGRMRLADDAHPPADRLYPTVLGDVWARLHPDVQRVHLLSGSAHATAQFVVKRAPGRLIGLLLDLARVPAASDAVPVRLTVEERTMPAGPQERWHRVFNGKPLVTHQAVAAGRAECSGRLLGERVGPLEFRFRLVADDADGAMVFEQQGCWLRLGRRALKVPRALAPVIWCRERATGHRAQTGVFVKVTTSRGALLFSYRGVVTWNVTDVTR